jgi:hypothetical protein
MIGVTSFLFITLAVINVLADTMPAPFSRQLKVTSPYMTGNDVLIAQTLLNRDSAVKPSVPTSGVYDEATAKGCAEFQTAISVKSTGNLDSTTAQKLLELHTDDNYKDSGFTAASMGYLYKFHIPVVSNRSVETYATLFDEDNNVLLKFRVRTHGKRDDGTSAAWPDFGNGDVGYTQFGSSGNTITGLVEVDLNSPEPDPASYGPYPINRLVKGLDGNAKLMQPNIRDGLLIHTGNWSTASQPWDPSMNMPNSNGCIHAHPEDVKKIYQILTNKLGVKVNANTFSGKNYPYKCQGIAIIELQH